LSSAIDPFVTLLEVHKLMYFMQEAGQRLKLQFVQAPYGTHAENLRHVLKLTEGRLISGPTDGVLSARPTWSTDSNRRSGWSFWRLSTGKRREITR
jgi:hypothetical protein